ncbi:MAG: hypothetical protein KJ826_14960 [Proteobacteria bacterium]|nr:hypothetical protein [Pseudomonadota bacterium]
MAICDLCGKEMEGASSCRKSIIRIDGIDYTPLPFGKEDTVFIRKQLAARCPECNVLKGGLHHIGCGLEICPKCGEKWLNCRCSGLKVVTLSDKEKKCKIIPFNKRR